MKLKNILNLSASLRHSQLEAAELKVAKIQKQLNEYKSTIKLIESRQLSYQKSRPTREKKLFNQIQHKKLNAMDINNYLAELSDINSEQQSLDDELQQIKQLALETDNELEEANNTLKKAKRVYEKIQQMKKEISITDKEQHLIDEDNELDEISRVNVSLGIGVY